MSGEGRASSTGRLHGDAVGILAVKVVGTGLAFLAQLVLARKLGADGLGAYALAMAMLNALLVFSRMGFDMSSLRLVPLFRDDGDHAGLHGFLRTALRVPGAVAVTLGGAAALVVAVAFEPGTVRTTLLVATAALLPWTVLLVDQGTLRAMGRRVTAFLPGEVVRPALLLLGILAAGGLVARAEDAPRAAAIHVGAIVVGALLARGLMRRTVPAEVRAAPPSADTPAWIRVSVALGVVSGLTALLAQVDTLLIGGLLTTTDVGLFAIARRVAALLAFGLLAVNSAVAPDFSRLWRDQKRARLQGLTRRAALLATLATLPPVLVFVFAGRTVLGWFGPEFVDAYPLLLLFSGGQLVNAMCGPVALLLTLTGYARETALVLAAALVALAAGILLAAPRWGVVGAAGASAGVLAGWNVAMVVVARIKLGLRVGLV